MAEILVVRHGETEWNATHRWQGFTGPELNAHGLEQARKLAAELDGVQIHAIFSSDAVRALQTAEAVAAGRRLLVRRDARLREVNFGEWEGLTRKEINELFSGAFQEWEACRLAAPTGGETDLEMAQRVLEAVGEIAHRHAGERVLVVTSGGPIRALQAHACGVDPAIARLHFARAENCAVLRFFSDGDTFTAEETPR